MLELLHRRVGARAVRYPGKVDPAVGAGEEDEVLGAAQAVEQFRSHHAGQAM